MPDAAPDSSTVAWSRRHTWIFGATLAALTALPWTVGPWPSQDGQNHLAVAHVILHYGDPGSPFPKYVDVEAGFHPSAANYAILCFLARAMPLQTAEKVLVSLAIALLPLALLVLVRRMAPRRSVNVLLALPFVVGWAFAMGFLSFQLGMGFGVLALALGWEPPDRPGDQPRIRATHAFAALSYFVCVWLHPVAALVTGLCFVVLEGPNALRWREWPRLALVCGPAALFLVGSYVTATPDPLKPPTLPDETTFNNPFSLAAGVVEYHVGYSLLELVPRFLALAFLVFFAFRGAKKDSLLGASPASSLLRAVVLLFVLYCTTPNAFHGWFYSSTRFLLYASLLLPAVAEVPARVGRHLAVLGPALTAAVTGAQWPDLRDTSRQMQDILDVGASLPRGSKIIPMDFTARLFGPQPLGHSWAELVVARDVVASQLFAAGKPRLGGERFRTLGFHRGMLDAKTGQLPWSTYEAWYDVARMCSPPGSPKHWFQWYEGTCDELLATRKAALEAVIDRYDYVLMLDPPAVGKDLVARHLRLVGHVGCAWLFAVVPLAADPTASAAPG